jgi:hypothetical protein
VTSKEGKVEAFLESDYKRPKAEYPDFDTTLALQNAPVPARQALKVDDGWIAAYNEGEFGSAVYWFNRDGTAKRKLSDHQVNRFLIEGDRIFAVEGLNHLDISRGSMIEITKGRQGWTAQEWIPLPASGAAIARIDAGDFIVVTSDMLLRVNLKREVLVLVPKADWGGLYPRSVAISKDGFIYVGMRQFVARCKLATSVQSVDFLVPDRTWLNETTQ